MTLKDLQNGQKVRCRRGRAGPEDVDWGPWEWHTLYVQRKQNGDPFIIALANVAWAEYRPDDYSFHYGVFECEEYYLEIENLEREQS